ncbi:hypothetical protein [Methanoregula formicica]|uniref:hypothetical protein n=1 Tax=Methanoregula formicica TaxID=882104 RepID=UPI00130E4D89|nr:hypothetical protein [Methanoregula formicica]
MCTSPPCPNGCRTQSGSNRCLHLYRAHIRVRGPAGKLKNVPVGWWCSGCHVFVDDLR